MIDLLTKIYLIDIRELDTRILSSFESDDTNLFFRRMAYEMKRQYETLSHVDDYGLRIHS